MAALSVFLMHRIRQKIRGIKFSSIARPLYWGKIFAKFNFANGVRSSPGSSRIMRMRIRTYGVPRSTI